MTEEEVMITSILDCDRTDIMSGRKKITEEQEAILSEMKFRRAEGEPLQYVIGNCDFMGCIINVTPDVLIPRPETEILVEECVNKVKQLGKNKLKVLDIGTGSGAIAIALAKYIDNCRVVAVDVSGEALKIAENNAANNEVSNKILFECKNAGSFLRNITEEKFDVIISNPPYIRTSDIDKLPEDVKKEPVLALDGGEDGLDFYRLIITAAKNHLKEGGFLAMEIGDEQVGGVLRIFEENRGYKNIIFKKDYVGTDRMVFAEIGQRF